MPLRPLPCRRAAVKNLRLWTRGGGYRCPCRCCRPADVVDEDAPSLPNVTVQSPAVEEFGARLAELALVRDLLVAGSSPTGDYVPGVSDLDLIAVVNGPVDDPRRAALIALHRRLHHGRAANANLGCVYLSDAQPLDV